ncbi:MAG: hypothetical protein KatS3mg103_1408 [Phycisphaerales bacterium]|nr:MAG: hypothetical protein KatS3mg103_1408 [Phycisphaerales bacterium]
MVIGVLQFELLVPGAESLKDKRSVVRSVRDRLYRELRISIAEVGAHDNPALALMGAAVVATDGPRAHQLLDKAWNRLTQLRDGQIGNVRREVIVPAREDLAEPVTGPDPEQLAQEMLAHYGDREAARPAPGPGAQPARGADARPGGGVPMPGSADGSAAP